jgi:3-oxoacyl-[acyl-carrier protein] reductase
MIHWLANAYAKKGITVNGIAPALIQDTKMLPGSNEELSKSMFKIEKSIVYSTGH